MKTSVKYLLWYVLSFALERTVLHSLSPTIGVLYAMISMFVIAGCEGNRFEKYLMEKYPEVLHEYRQKTITGNVWIHKYIRSHMKKSDPCDLELMYNCRRVFLVSHLALPVFLSLVLAGLL